MWKFGNWKKSIFVSVCGLGVAQNLQLQLLALFSLYRINVIKPQIQLNMQELEAEEFRLISRDV